MQYLSLANRTHFRPCLPKLTVVAVAVQKGERMPVNADAFDCFVGIAEQT
jgi:hypothetical protein